MRLMRVCVLLTVVSDALLASRAGVAQTAPTCSPACGADQTCANGACVAAATPAAAVLPSAPPPAPRPLWREGKTVVPFVGANSFQGNSGTNVGVGLRVGTLLGSRLSENWSLNAEAAIDVMNMGSFPTAMSAKGYMLDLAFAPLFHVPQQKLELVVGPIVGPWSAYERFYYPSPQGSTFSWSVGWALGANAGVMFPVSSNVRLGGLLSFVARNPVTLCAGGTGIAEDCTTHGLHAAKVFAFTLAAML